MMHALNYNMSSSIQWLTKEPVSKKGHCKPIAGLALNVLDELSVGFEVSKALVEDESNARDLSKQPRTDG